jgi:hypothetical protein
MSFERLLDARFKTEPWEHQLAEFERSAGLPARALIWQMRTGKTKFTLDCASSQWDTGDIDCLLIFAPNGVHSNWLERELPLHLWEGIEHEALAWRTRVAGLKGGNRLSKADKAAWEDCHAAWWAGFHRGIKGKHLLVCSFNSESMIRDDIRRAVAKLLHTRKCFVAWDESTDFRSPGSTRSKMSRALARKAVTRRILDGTMLHNSPLHAFAQFELLEKAALGYARHDDRHGPSFLGRYAVFGTETHRGRTHRVITGTQNLEELRDRIAKYSSVVLREDCHGLPALVPVRRPVKLSKEQERLLRELKKQTLVEFEGGELVSIGAQTNRLLKFQQIVGGWLIGEDKVPRRIPGTNPRLEALSKEVYLAAGKVIVWCQFKHELDEVAARLRLDGHTVLEYHGRTSDEDRAYVRSQYPLETEKVVLVAQAQSAGRGLELPAGLIIWYSHTNNTIIRAQADERATVMGGGNVNLMDFESPAVDGYMLDNLANNISTADDMAGRGLKAVIQRLNIGD